MRSFSFVFGLIIFALIAYAAYFFYNQTYEMTIAEMQDSASPPPFPSIIPSPSTATDSATEASGSGEIPKDWKSTRSAKYSYTISFPSSMKYDTSAEGDRYYWFGETQSLGTELYDGISLLISGNVLAGQTVEEFAKSEHDKIAKQETTQSITKVIPVTFGVHQGFQFTVTSLGTGDYIYLAGPNASYLQIINMTVQPQTSSVKRYEDITKQIISSIRF